MVHVRKKRLGMAQCDHMAIMFVQYFAVKNNENLHNNM